MRRRPLEFEAGDLVLIKVTPMKGVIQFGKKNKLTLVQNVDTMTVFNRRGNISTTVFYPSWNR